ncbi:MAG TPA: hypothetical protein VJ738_01905 [Steroidobacteraceae bacterium]|nr:hypothetical protein [Steroidobacteraceae bacterium]
MSLGKNLTLGDSVSFIDANQRKHVATVISIRPSGTSSRCLTLFVFPENGNAPFVANGIEHVSLVGPGVETAWDFLDAAATVSL